MQNKDCQKLLNCPFCGGEVCINRINHRTNMRRDYWYLCNKCGAYTMMPVKSKYTNVTEIEKEAEEVWNRRAEK